ncbi:MAG: ABC transporter ATP-binding protein [Firmicutes bacterium]|nr:ABC transporter ATP-binding protein [Bacillota bacterium]
MAEKGETLIRVQELSVGYGGGETKRRRRRMSAPVRAVDGVTLELAAGECLGVIGESGSGKSTFGYALLNLLPKPGRILGGSVELAGVGDLAALSEHQWQKVRGNRIGMVFQGAQSMFNPLMTFEQQLRDTFRAQNRDPGTGMVEARDLLKRARLDPERILRSYPHELSGGMRQRVAIVAGAMLGPDLLILDEPTTALDVLSQAMVLEILKELRSLKNMSMIFITHDFSVASNISDRIAVMYAGRIVEVGNVRSIYRRSGHPYTRALIRSVPSLSAHTVELVSVPGQPPDMRNLPPGCRFAPRCPLAVAACQGAADMRLETVGDSADHAVMCIRREDMMREEVAMPSG